MKLYMKVISLNKYKTIMQIYSMKMHVIFVDKTRTK